MNTTSWDIEEIFPEIKLISDDDLLEKVKSVWNGLVKCSKWKNPSDVPTSKEIPYPHVPHNQCVLKMALDVADSFEKFHGVTVDRDVLIASAVLQDASKLVEFSPDDDGGVELTQIGKTYPHAFWGAHKAAEAGLPSSVVEIILKHTPSAAQFPGSLEGKILYYVDQLDVLAIYKDRWKKNLFITK